MDMNGGISISFLFQEYFIHQKKIQSFEYIKQYIESKRTLDERK